MMATTEKTVSLVIRARDTASAVVKATGDRVGQLAAGIKRAFSIAGGAAVGLNQGLELVKKALALVSAGYEATVGRALALRAANDPTRRDMEALAKAAEGLQVSIGNALLPVIRTLAQALAPVLQSMTTWVNANRDIIATNLTGWIVQVAQGLTSGIAVAVLLVTRAWYGWGMAIEAAKTSFLGMASAGATWASRLQKSVAAIASPEEAQKLQALSRLTGLLGEAGAQAADKSSAALAAQGAELSALEKKIADVAFAVQSGLGDAGAKIAGNLRSAIRLTGKEIEEWNPKIAGINTLIAEWRTRTLALAQANIALGADQLASKLRTVATEYERVAQNAEATDQLRTGLAALREEYGGAADAALRMTGSLAGAQAALSEATTKTQGLRDVVTGIANGIGSAFTGMISAAIEQTQTASEIILGFFGNVGRAIIDTLISIAVQTGITALINAVLGSALRKAGIAGYAAEAAAAAYASTAAIPIFGPILAPAAAAKAFAETMAFQALALASGGLIVGGMSGQDSVPAMLMPGEYVIPAAQVRENVRSGRAPDDSGQARAAGGGGGGSSVSGTVVVQSMVAPSAADLDRAIHRQLVPALERLSRKGRLRT
jgi:hypothetical protein